MNQFHSNIIILRELLWLSIGMASAIIFCCLLSLLKNEFRETHNHFFSIFSQPLKHIFEWILNLLQSVKSWLKGQIDNECTERGQSPIYLILGSIIMAVLTVIFILCDWGQMVLTYQAMGLEKANTYLPVDTTTLVASALVSAGLFWGIILCDLGKLTHLGPWRKASPRIRKLLLVASIFFIILAAFLAIIGGNFRAESLQQIFTSEEQASHIKPLTLDSSGKLGGFNLGGSLESLSNVDDSFTIDPSTLWNIKVSFMGIAFLSICTSAVSMVGLAMAGKFLFLAAIALICILASIVTFLIWALYNVINHIEKFSNSLLDIFIACGDLILQVFGKKPNFHIFNPKGLAKLQPFQQTETSNDGQNRSKKSRASA